MMATRKDMPKKRAAISSMYQPNSTTPYTSRTMPSTKTSRISFSLAPKGGRLFRSTESVRARSMSYTGELWGLAWTLRAWRMIKAMAISVNTAHITMRKVMADSRGSPQIPWATWRVKGLMNAPENPALAPHSTRPTPVRES